MALTLTPVAAIIGVPSLLCSESLPDSESLPCRDLRSGLFLLPASSGSLTLTPVGAV